MNEEEQAVLNLLKVEAIGRYQQLLSQKEVMEQQLNLINQKLALLKAAKDKWEL